ncbi:MAG: DMT family transporter [Chloroflexota bacterium]
MLGLVSALTWGAGDFGGGLLVRHTPLFGVVLVSQLVGMVLALALSLLRGETAPLPADLGWSVLGGISGVIGITALYRGLAVGRMGIVAPVTGVLAALIPVVAGIVTEGVPPTLVLVGIVLAIIAVILVSRVKDEAGRPSGLHLALIGGLAIGAFSVFVAQVSDGHAFGPLALIRGVEALLMGAVVVVSGAAWRPSRRLLPAIAAVGVLDMAGNGAFILAVQTGALAVAAVLSSLYPVTTVILAAIFLRERVTRTHAAGIALAVTAIACIAVGSAG